MSDLPFKSQLKNLLLTMRADSEEETTNKTQKNQNQHITYFEDQAFSYYYIDRSEDLSVAISDLEEGLIFYVDTEFQTFKKKSILSLLQISTGKDIYVIDVYELGAEPNLIRVLSRPNVEWVLHDARSDIPLLCDTLGIPAPSRVFDTQVAWGFQHNNSQIGLAHLLKTLFDHDQDKRFQMVKFLQRPLPTDWIEYAASDIPPLLKLRKELFHLIPDERLHNAIYEVSIERIPLTSIDNIEDSSSKRSIIELDEFKGHFWKLNPQQLESLKFLIHWLNHTQIEAPELQQAPRGKTLVSIAVQRPRDQGELLKIQGVNTRFARRFGSSLLREMCATTQEIPTQWGVDPEGRWSEENKHSFTSSDRFEKLMIQSWVSHLISMTSARLKISKSFLFHERASHKISMDTFDRDQLITHFSNLCVGWRKEIVLPVLIQLVKTFPWIDPRIED